MENHGTRNGEFPDMSPLKRAAFGRLVARRFAAIFTVLALALAFHARAAIQFDVFIGYDGITREASWFPVAIEVHNDGPSFNGIIELSSSQFGGEPDRRIPVELPTNTRKRIIVPMFAGGGRNMGNWDARLLDSGRKIRAERQGVQVRSVDWQTVMLGALPRSFGGMPSFPKIKVNRPELQPAVARFQQEQFPDNPIALEGLDALYINSEKAISLGAPQLEALLAWVRGGGHLIIAVEQVADVSGTPWLQQFLPVDVSGVHNAEVDQAIISWLKSDISSEESEEVMSGRAGTIRRPRNPNSADASGLFYSTLDTDASFVGAQMPVATGSVRDGRIIMGSAQSPIAVQATRGRGKLTVLLFSPEREPFKSWKHKGYFWARLSGTPPQWFTSSDYSSWGAWSMDGVFGALIDSRQVKKLPVEWLLLLLLVYLVVIGPFDQWWLKKINRQMLTWITFPCYVVFFSLLIYFIGYKLRAGETEWNEVQIVDVYPRGEQADLRGRTYVSVYSSSNARYPVVGESTNYSSVRPEFLDMYGAGNARDTKMQVEQAGNSFKAQVFVPVWTSLLFVNDWFKTDDRPLNASVSRNNGEFAVKVQNPTKHKLTNVKVVIDKMIFDIGTLEPDAQFEKTLNPASGTPLQQFIDQTGGSSIFQSAVDRRRNPLGGGGITLDDRARTLAAASFYRMIEDANNSQRSIVGAPGLDMSAEMKRGDAIVLAWDQGNIWTKPVNQFQPVRMRRDSMLRLVVPVKKS